MPIRRYWQSVFLPALIPIALIAFGQTFELPSHFDLIPAALLLAAAGLYLKRLQSYWGYVHDVGAEFHRFRRLIWLIIPLFFLNAFFLISIYVRLNQSLLIWIFSLVKAGGLFVLLTLLLQFFRFSPDLLSKRRRIIVALVAMALLFFTNWPGEIKFMVLFLLSVWTFNFEDCLEVPLKTKLLLTLFSAIGFILLLALGSSSLSSTSGSGVSATLSTLIAEYEAGLLPLLPSLTSGLRLLVLALFIVLPGKILLRPIADWLKFSLRIRTKLMISYLFSSVLPALLIILVLLMGMFFLVGGFWQLYIDGLLKSESQNMAAWEASATRFQNPAVFSLGLSDSSISVPDLTLIEAKTSSDTTLQNIQVMDLNPASDSGFSSLDSISLAALLLPESLDGAIDPISFQRDTTLIKLGRSAFSGLIWFEQKPFISDWSLKGGVLKGRLQPFTLESLNELKSHCGTDLVLYSGKRFEISSKLSGGVQINMGGAVDPALSTPQTTRRTGFFNIPLTFPVLLPGVTWDAQSGFEEHNSALLIKTSIYSLLSVLFSRERVVNQAYLAFFIALAGFFGVILILVALVGFGLAGGINRTINKLRQGTQQLRNGDLSVNIQVRTKDELGELAQSFNLMVADLNRMLIEIKEKERLEGELEAAKAIQMRLLPEQIPVLAGFQIAATSIPAKQVGGDYYDFLELPYGHTGLAVGDVSGKGMPAALLMANLQACLRTLTLFNLPPALLIEKLNTVLCHNTAPHMFATFFFGSLDHHSGELTYVNAGHNYPIICGNGKAERLVTGGMLLGVMPDSNYEEGHIELAPGHMLVLFSDGITEAADDGDIEFGEERLLDLLSRHCHDDADTILRSILSEVESYCGVPQDDMTLMVLKRV
ncbi:MAG: SpoIIE family protein phosphatase [bacterium]|nr:SpoIIE family protein phosphatase [bacterium]